MLSDDGFTGLAQILRDNYYTAINIFFLLIGILLYSLNTVALRTSPDLGIAILDV